MPACALAQRELHCGPRRLQARLPARHGVRRPLPRGDHRLRLSEADYQGIWGTRSGCRIGTVNERGSDPEARQVIFKEGLTDELVAEKEALKRWAERFPGVPPRVFGFQEHADHAALLLEFLPSRTFQRIVVDSTRAELKEALVLILARIGSIWEHTLVAEPARASFLVQLHERLRAIMKPTGVFYTPASGIPAEDPDEDAYVERLAGCRVYAISGGTDFDAAADRCLALLARS